MQVALYLYNSREVAARDFAVELKTALAGTSWELKVDFQGAVEAGDDSLVRLHEEIRKANAVIYALGPQGPGIVQGNFELSQIVQAQLASKRRGEDYKIIPTLLAGAKPGVIPPLLDTSSAVMDNSHQQGRNVLQTVYRALTGRDLPMDPDPSGKRLVSSKEDVKSACGWVAKKVGVHGLTLFVGPYAAADVHDTPGPSRIGGELLQRIAGEALKRAGVSGCPDGLLIQPWMAAISGRLIEHDDEEIWKALRAVVEESAPATPLPLEEAIALLAGLKCWQPSSATDAKWRGLLIVTTEQHRRLEQALANKKIAFGRMRYVRSDRGLIYETVKPGGGPLEFEEAKDLKLAKKASQSVPPVLVLKLLSCMGNDDLPLLTTGDFVKFSRQSAGLPQKINGHIGAAPFVMLGGGLLNPVVSFAFAAHFKPCFKVTDAEEGGKPPRYVALHTAGRNVHTDAIRKFELAADFVNPDWPAAFDLERIDWSLPDFVDRLASEISERAASVVEKSGGLPV